eukprot:2558201-Rhodomonas_salina.2
MALCPQYAMSDTEIALGITCLQQPGARNRPDASLPPSIREISGAISRPLLPCWYCVVLFSGPFCHTGPFYHAGTASRPSFLYSSLRRLFRYADTVLCYTFSAMLIPYSARPAAVALYSAMRCAVLRSCSTIPAIVLCACYVMSGTDSAMVLLAYA